MPHPRSAAPGLAVVTGASSGIGAAIARELSLRGHPVLAVARRAERLEALSADAAGAGGAAVHPFPLDVTAAGAPERLLARARELGGAAWLVNNAGAFLLGHADELPAAAQASLVRLNCEAVVVLAATFLPDLVARGSGVLLNLASLSGLMPTPFYAAYGASKAFVVSFTEAIAEELRGTGVTATAFCLGPSPTEIFGDRPRRTRAQDLAPEVAARMALDAAEKGRVVAVGGALNRLVSLVPRLVPRALLRRIARRTTVRYIGLEEPRRAPPRRSPVAPGTDGH